MLYDVVDWVFAFIYILNHWMFMFTVSPKKNENL